MTPKTLTRAAVLAFLAITQAADREALSSLSVDDVQQLLAQYELDEFFGEAFAKYKIDGNTLEYLQQSDMSPEDFPDAKAFHWSKFWGILQKLKDADSSTAAANKQQQQARQRRLASEETHSGISIKRENAWVALGPDSDVSLSRTGDNELSVTGRLLVDSSTGEQMDVADQLEALLDQASTGTADERIDTLIDMVALNTELLMNVTSICQEAAENTAEVPIYTCIDSLNSGDASGSYLTEDYGYVLCNNDLSVGGWTLALNIDTSDGNVVSYNNAAFWEDSSTMGGATNNINQALKNDYKNNEVFGNFAAGEVMVVVHEEGEVLGFRAFTMADTTQPLSYYFQGGADGTNVCGSSFEDQVELGDGYVTMTNGAFDAEVGDLIEQEPMVFKDNCDLVANIDMSGSNDYNRLTCAEHPEDAVDGNYGYGLGTLYDASHDIDGNSIGTSICPSDTKRPVCDAQLYSDDQHWGSEGTGIGGMIGEDNTCNDDCPWTVESGFNYDYAIYVREASAVSYSDCEDAMEEGAATGAYLLSSGKWVYCNNDVSLGGWTLALNVDTSDGNVVSYNNYDFWESSTELGGAKNYAPRPFVHDYKNPDVFSSFEANEVLVVLHEEGEMLGYRAWTLATPGQPLVEYFNGGDNTCGSSADTATTLSSGSFNYVTSAVIDSYVGDDVIAEEPLIYNDDYQLYSNIETGESNDYNRLTAKDHPELTDNAGNLGWGLGTLYDATHDGNGDSLGYAPCPSETMRPLCDGQLHVDTQHWGSEGDLGGMIGTDHECNNDCPWTVPSGYAYDYAIYVRKSTPVYYDSCSDVAAAGEASGQYMLSNNNHVYCYVDDSGGGWTLALNIATSDGNVVHYSNVDFWESATELGGATEHHATPFRQDYKNTYVFSEYEPSSIMVVIHENGVGAQSDSLGWRSWALASTTPLVNLFTSVNVCGDGVTSDDFDQGAYVQVTNGVTGGAVYNLASEEPMVYHDSYELYANVENGDSHDYNRMAAKSSATQADANYGWGLGTMYDATHGDTSYMCGPDGSSTARPQCDAQFHTTVQHWGSNGGIGGMIGTDNVCVSDCPWTVESGYYYDYAIFVQ